MSSSIRGNQVLSGTWGEIWVDGEPILECKKIEVKPQVQREVPLQSKNALSG